MRMLTFFIAVLLTGFVGKSAETTASSNNGQLYGPHVIVDSDLQETVDAWFKGAATNGVVCAIAFGPSSRKESPAFDINVINTTTNFIHGFVRLPFEMSANIELFDSRGKPVAKTAAGMKIKACTDRQADDWFEANRAKPRPPGYVGGKSTRDTKGIVDVLFPLSPMQISNEISLLKLFQIKDAGEYELHFRMRAAFTHVDSAGNIGLTIFSFPEVVASVRVPLDDIPVDNGTTNSL